ncbi:MAG TPA: SEC-C metal-binding domain-containing protein [Spirochaetota bacterium]|nr:SEC-C metal-binding domain-containing protein [Spirochaetota bacterium]
MPYVSFHDYFPEIAERETRSFETFESSKLPKDVYSLIELYCDEEECDCRRVFFEVFSKNSGELLAVICYGWEKKSFYEDWYGRKDNKVMKELMGPSLNLGSPQSEYAETILEYVKEFLLIDKKYIERLKRHYRMFKDIIDKKYNENKMIFNDNLPIVNANKTGRNDLCPCGSGKKYKKCCGK